MIKNFTIHTSHIPVRDLLGKKIAEVVLPEKITPSLLRRGGFSDSGIYYKGAGILYRGHLTNEPGPNEKIIKTSSLFYQKYTVVHPALIKQFGIFTFPHQPAFSDYEGCCGPKEAKLPAMAENFALSAISEIVDVIDTGLPGQKIYAYRMRDLSGKPEDVISLFTYILEHDYNSAWDKNLWADVAGYCYVRDLADWFVSKKFCHKLGTIYALLSSILTVDKYLFSMITNHFFGMNYFDSLYLPYLSACIVKKLSPESCDAFPYDISHFSLELYEALLQELYSGKACCHLENETKWHWVRDEYKKNIPHLLAHLEQDYKLMQQRYHENLT